MTVPSVDSSTEVTQPSPYSGMVKSLRGGEVYRFIAAEISALTAYYNRVVEIFPRDHDAGELLSLLKCANKSSIPAGEDIPDLSSEVDQRTAFLLNGTFNHHFDIQGLLLDLRSRLSRTSRLIVVAYNPYLAWVYRLATRLGIRKGEVPTVFLTRVDLNNLCRLAGYEVVQTRPVAYFPYGFFGLGRLINRVMPAIPGFRWLALVHILVIRPVISQAAVAAAHPSALKPSLSILIPARNEKGNIENALKRMPDLGAKLQIIFVEGHSSDGTWDEILRVQREYGSRFEILAFQQTGKGKNDAVRLGFSRATADLLTILDADLTMPPELLGRFYDAYCEGKADFINGTRLVYPMEGEAMRFLNHLGNIFFAKALSSVLGTHLGDSLCGTKLLARHDYKRIIDWRGDFGDFDPFGDFELLFPASILGLGVVDVPIRYRARTYGATNISRFYHGWMLLRMTLIGLFRIKMGKA